MLEVQVVAIEANPEEAFKDIDLTQRLVLLVFGDIFETSPELGRLRNYFTDFFGANNQDKTVDVERSLSFVITLIGYEDNTFEFRFHRFIRKEGALVDLAFGSYSNSGAPSWQTPRSLSRRESSRSSRRRLR